MIPWHVAAMLLCPWNSPGENTGVDSHSLLQGILLTQGSNLGRLHWRQNLYPLSQVQHNHKGFLEVEKEGRRKVKVRERDAMVEAEVGVIKCEKESTLLMALKMEESHEAKNVHSWIKQGNRFCLTTSKKKHRPAYQHLHFHLVRPTSHFWSTKL